MDFWPGSSPDDGDLFEMAIEHDAIQRSSLIRVVGIEQAVDDNGLVLELLALEVRAAGAVLHWRARAVGEHVLGGPDFAVVDDVGTIYTLLPPTWLTSEGVASGDTHLVPSPPETARTMQVDVRQIGGLGSMAPPGFVRDEPVAGRWTFDFQLD